MHYALRNGIRTDRSFVRSWWISFRCTCVSCREPAIITLYPFELTNPPLSRTCSLHSFSRSSNSERCRTVHNQTGTAYQWKLRFLRIEKLKRDCRQKIAVISSHRCGNFVTICGLLGNFYAQRFITGIFLVLARPLFLEFYLATANTIIGTIGGVLRCDTWRFKERKNCRF